MADKVEGARREMDDRGLLVLPGGIASHVHLAQPSGPEITPADARRGGRQHMRSAIRAADKGPVATPWEGFQVTGWPVMTIARGDVVAEEGRIVGRNGRGEIFERVISPYAAAPA
jgi:hypothetical protein